MREIRVLSQGWEDPLGEGYGNPLQDSCLENSTDKGAWQATVHGVAKSWTQLSNQHTFWVEKIGLRKKNCGKITGLRCQAKVLELDFIGKPLKDLNSNL